MRLERSKSTRETRSIIKEVIDSCGGPEYDRFRRLLRNFIMCCLGRGSWKDDLNKPMPLEEFEMLYDNYPKWATVEKEKGIKEGIEKGRTEERAAIFSELLASLKAKLVERFGILPHSWGEPLARLADPGRIIDLTSAACTVRTAEEFEARLFGK